MQIEFGLTSSEGLQTTAKRRSGPLTLASNIEDSSVEYVVHVFARLACVGA
jgi:hypothetical protein